MSRKVKVAAFLGALVLGAIALGCSEDSNYDQRTVVYVSAVNDNEPFLCDVLNQGDSLWNSTKTAYKLDDDYVTEEWVKVQFHNKPYNGIVDPSEGSLGDVLITSYDVVYTPLGGAPLPVPSFTGETSIFVPADEFVEANILICPFASKQVSPLVDLQYSLGEIMSYAHVVFHAEEVQTSNTFTFEATFTVNFADPLNTKDNQQ